MHRKAFYFLVVLLLAAAAAAFADTLHGTNGDRITGSLKELSGEQVIFATYGGELKVKRTDVMGLTTEKPFRVTLKAGQVHEGRLVWKDSGQLVVNGKGEQPVQLKDVASIVLPNMPESLPALDSIPGLEPESEKEKKDLWSGSVEAGVTWRTGQTNSTEGQTAISLVRKQPKNTLTLNASGGYGALESEVNTRRAKGEGKWQLYPKDGMYYYVLGGLEHDAGRKLDLRANAAGGVGYDFIKKEQRSLSGDVGLEYAREYWNPYDILGRDKAEAAAERTFLTTTTAYLQGLRNDPNWLSAANRESALQVASAYRATKEEPEDTVKDDISLRLAGKYEQKILEKSKVSNEVALVPNVDNFEAYRLSNDLAFSTPLGNGLSLRLNLKTDVDSDIGSTGTSEVDNSLFSTLRYEF